MKLELRKHGTSLLAMFGTAFCRKKRGLETCRTTESKHKFVLFPKVLTTTRYVRQLRSHDRLKVLRLHGLNGTSGLRLSALNSHALPRQETPPELAYTRWRPRSRIVVDDLRLSV